VCVGGGGEGERGGEDENIKIAVQKESTAPKWQVKVVVMTSLAIRINNFEFGISVFKQNNI